MRKGLSALFCRTAGLRSRALAQTKCSLRSLMAFITNMGRRAGQVKEWPVLFVLVLTLAKIPSGKKRILVLLFHRSVSF